LSTMKGMSSVTRGEEGRIAHLQIGIRIGPRKEQIVKFTGRKVTRTAKENSLTVTILQVNVVLKTFNGLHPPFITARLSLENAGPWT
jgi:hypothetical protein